MNKNKFDFITSPVFWQLFLIGVVAGLFVIFPENMYVKGLATMISIWFGGSVGINTVNKRSEKMVEVAKISAGTTTVSLPSNVSSVTASTENNG